MVRQLIPSITFGGWNIDGLYKRENKSRINKLDEEEIMNIILGTDIVMLVETHCNNNDHFSLPGYSVHNQIRPKSPGARKHFGGISVLIKDNIRPGVTFLPSSNSEFIWFKLCHSYFRLQHDLYVLAVYICPENSSFTGKAGDTFQLIETDIAKYSQLGQCLIFGDFNGRTAVEPDFCAHDDNLTKFTPSDGSNRVDCATPRKNSDISPVDNNGRHLLDLCIGSGVRILNGRVFGDSLGCHTCFSHNGNPSTIDYFLASKGILDRAKYLQVFNPSIHSIHCYIKLSISTKSLLERQSSDKYKGMVAAVKYKWDNNVAHQFQNTVMKNMGSMKIPKPVGDSSQESIDNLASDLNDFFHRCANEANIIKSKMVTGNHRKPLKNKSKKWFTPTLSNLKKELFNLAKCLRASPYDQNKRQLFHSKKKKYKQLVKQTKYKYEQDMVNHLINLEKGNPKEFWKVFRQIRDLDATYKENPIDPAEWVSHFKALLNIKPEISVDLKQHVDDILSSNATKIFNELNYRIRHEEFITVIHNLKKVKRQALMVYRMKWCWLVCLILLTIS